VVAHAVSRLAPAVALGEATGLQSSALGAGFALGSPVAGMAIDASGPGAGFAAAGLVGLAAALAGCLLSRRAPGGTGTPLTEPGHVAAPDLEPSGVGAHSGRSAEPAEPLC
jgi:hypothetical protein